MKNYSLFLIFALVLLVSCQKNSENILNLEASIEQSDELKENPLLMKPITSSIQPKIKTMSTLYGNDIAFDYAKTNFSSDYPENAVLYEVTWAQKPDELWFGANIPKSMISVEKISFLDKGLILYEMFQGKALKRVKTDNKNENLRIDAILSQKMAVSP
ncbi:hypothetical protein [Chryseobacterium jejuense]|uniref:Uncharacterized protein n=1 Tax=Chryseobacterium jejuense TaxID=445960 RepID=A0A2X2X3H3_CHRJE|nr:hypothetical protein [Chryseobacterium jejuense]SDI11342.1 hypothetical protein SAMN05421542_0110 [Chryseobacterium jejuense]SQB47446.1 Uncharacterised protein [Chryseobacterium jejuense]